jgi:hypothetical protein
MDDQQGNVIDGTARARQWRLARSKTPAATQDAEARSDAPKSIAGSLLVPADMFPVASPGDQHPNGDEQSRATERPPGCGAVAADRGADEDTVHQNPFLLPQAAAVASAGRGTRPARRRLIAALLTRSVGAAEEIGLVPPGGPRIALRGDVEQAAQRAKRWATRGKYARDGRHPLRPGRAVIVSAVLLSVVAVSVIGIASQTNSSGAGPRPAGTVTAAFSPIAGAGATAKRVIGALGVFEHHVRTGRARGGAVQADRRPREKSRARTRHVRSRRSARRRGSSPPATAPSGAPSTSSHSSPSSSPVHSPAAASSPITSQPAPTVTQSAPQPSPTVTQRALQPAGPSGPGGTVGSNCNPKCS